MVVTKISENYDKGKELTYLRKNCMSACVTHLITFGAVIIVTCIVAYFITTADAIPEFLLMAFKGLFIVGMLFAFSIFVLFVVKTFIALKKVDSGKMLASEAVIFETFCPEYRLFWSDIKDCEVTLSRVPINSGKGFAILIATDKDNKNLYNHVIEYSCVDREFDDDSDCNLMLCEGKAILT